MSSCEVPRWLRRRLPSGDTECSLVKQLECEYGSALQGQETWAKTCSRHRRSMGQYLECYLNTNHWAATGSCTRDASQYAEAAQ